MKSKEYFKHVKRTESPHFNPINMRLLHGAIGVATEAGELVDIVKKVTFYKRKLAVPDIIEEVGDILWYLALVCDEAGVTFEEIMERNVAKLQKRYPERFSTKAERNRDYNAERDAMMNDSGNVSREA